MASLRVLDRVRVVKSANLTFKVTVRPATPAVRILIATFADSLGTHPQYFNELYVNMVRAGEASGSLAVVFERLSEFERTRDDLRNYIISSMIYPALLASVGLASVVLLLTFVVPRFATIFADPAMKKSSMNPASAVTGSARNAVVSS